MNEEIERSILIDNYLSGSLTAEEMARFEEQLQEDAALKTELENYEISREAIRNYALRAELKEIRQKMMVEADDEPEAKQVSFWSYSMRAAAAIVLVVVAFAAIQMATLSGEDLYQGKAFPDEVWTIRGNADGVSDQTIKERYAASDYQGVIEAYSQMEAPSITATFITANAYLQQNEADKAIATFKDVQEMNEKVSTDDKRFVDDADYYLGLSYLRSGDYDRALEEFEDIKKSDSRYSEYIGSYFLFKLKMLDWTH